MNRRDILKKAGILLTASLPTWLFFGKSALADFTTSLDVETKVAFRRKSIRTMSDLVDLTQVSVQAEEYETALNTFFSTARKIWFMFGGTVKRQAPELFEPTQNNIKQVYEELSKASPNQDLLLTTLAELQTAMKKAVAVSDANL